MDLYKISVIIPVFNAERYIRCAFNSLLNQTIGFETLQVIFVDDCSIDDTLEILKEFKEKYENVFIYQTLNNTGAAGEPRNTGLNHAQAPYIMFLDSDDSLVQNACAFLYDQIEREQADIVGGTYRFIGSESQDDEFHQPNGDIARSEYHLPEDLPEALRYRFPMWTKIYKRELVENNHIRFLKTGHGEDTVFLCECLVKASNYILYGMPVYNYRVHQQSVTNQHTLTFFEQNRDCMAFCGQVLKDYPQAAQWLQGNLSNYYLEKCIEFEALSKDELITVFEENRELFVHEWEVSETAVAAVLIQNRKDDLAADYILSKRAEKKEKDQLQEMNRRIADIEQKMSILEIKEKQIMERDERILKYEEQLRQQEQKNSESLSELRRLEHELRLVNNQLNLIHQSDFYKLSLKYYNVRDRLFPVDSVQQRFVKKVYTGVKGLLHCGSANEGVPKNQLELLQTYGKYRRMDIITTPHTLFVAKLLKRQLDRLSIECRIHVGEPEEYLEIPYIIICSQFLKRFPKVYFVFQMEQTVSSRWFTPQYYTTLQNSCGILDYSLENVEYFHRPEQHDVRSRVYYLPIDYLPGLAKDNHSQEKEYDVLFYGDAKNERRQRILNRISQRYKVKVCSEVFGEDVYDEIRKCKVLVNIHYYEGALLETTRLYETLSLNTCMIVSEDSSDVTEMSRLQDFVDFVAIDDVDAMIERVSYWVEHDAEREERVKENQEKLEARANAFDYYFNRFLLAYDRIDFDRFYQIAGDFFQIHTNRICLTLPESTKRRRSFDEDNKYGFECIPGLRHQKGWVGCGLSYKLIFKKAVEAKMDKVMICEDDVIFPHDFSRRLDEILEYLHDKGEWSVFSGLLADADKIHILKSEKKGDVCMAQVDHMISMVFNIYNESIFKDVIEWDEQNRDVQKNAIDRYLERKKLKIYVQLPFLVGHKEELDSTIWGFSNIQYLEMIKRSEKKLLDMAVECREK